jgi:hypothetical protein
MKYLKYLLLFILPLLAFTNAHKYYMSVTEIDYVQDKNSVQITTRIFIDDFENTLRERYGESITLAEKNEPRTIDIYIERYLKEKIRIKIDENAAILDFIGKEYDIDFVTCYFEITDITSISSFKISNTVLFKMFAEQQNIIKTKINSKQKSYILVPEKDNVLLNFN